MVDQMAEGKRNRIATKAINEPGDTLTFSWGDGKSTVVKISDVPKEMYGRLAMHGLSQKLGDAYSGAETADEARESMAVTLATLKSGQWRVESESGPRIGRTVLVSERMFTDNPKIWAKVGAGKPISRDAVRDVLAGMDEAKRKLLVKAPEYIRADAALKTDAAKSAKGSVSELFA